MAAGVVGSFLASKPYDIRFFCEGSGNFYLTYDTNMGEVEQSTHCSSSPLPYGSQTWPATGREVIVKASADLGVRWAVLVEAQS